MSSFSHPLWDVTQNISAHHEFQGADNFCSDSSAVDAHLAEGSAYLLYTSICYTGQIKCVLMQKSLLYASMCMYTLTEHLYS